MEQILQTFPDFSRKNEKTWNFSDFSRVLRTLYCIREDIGKSQNHQIIETKHQQAKSTNTRGYKKIY